MNTIDINTTARVEHRLATIAGIGGLGLILAAIIALAAVTDVTSDGIFGSVGDYWAQVGEALSP